MNGTEDKIPHGYPMFTKPLGLLARIERPHVAKLLRILSATWCGASLWIMGLAFNASTTKAFSWVFYELRLGGLGDAVADAVLLTGYGICSAVFGIAFGRFLVRSMPPSLTGTVLHGRRGLATAVVLV
jgi:hypothetical protein